MFSIFQLNERLLTSGLIARATCPQFEYSVRGL
jgi:hypothetical protein